MPIALLGAVACMPEEEVVRDIPPIVWSGAQLDYAPQPGAYEPCAGTLPYMDRYVALVADVMGVEVDRSLVYVQGSAEVVGLGRRGQAGQLGLGVGGRLPPAAGRSRRCLSGR